MGKLRTFLALDSADKIASLEAIALLILTKAAVARIPPRRWKSHLASLSKDEHQSTDMETIRRVRLAIQRVLRTLPGAPNCLPQALAARQMLKQRGIASRLFIGTLRNAEGALHFHAWLKVGDEWVTGLCDESAYTLLLPDTADAAWPDSARRLAP